MQEQLPRTSATERATDGLEACLRGQVPRVAADRLALNSHKTPCRRGSVSTNSNESLWAAKRSHDIQSIPLSCCKSLDIRSYKIVSSP